MIYVTYGKMSREGLNGLTAKPENRAEALGKMVDALGGKLIDYYFLLNGEIDFIIVSEFPDDQNVNELSLVDALLVRVQLNQSPLFQHCELRTQCRSSSEPRRCRTLRPTLNQEIEFASVRCVCLLLFVVVGALILAKSSHSPL